MSRAEREAFLSELHLGVFAVANGASGPLAAPVWYGYEPGGDIWFSTGRSSLKAKLIQPGSRVSFVVQDETPPYRYVSVEGPVTLEDCDYERHLRTVAVKYLGPEGGEQYLRGTGGPAHVAENVVVRITPETWRTQDYTKVSWD
jgi:PPOX class probable F420-dependent enzyme